MPLFLEAFDAPDPAVVSDVPEGPSADWLDGFAAGQAEGLALGRAEAEAEASHISQDLARTLQDMAFAYAEARGQVLASLRPLFMLLIDRMLPALAAESLAPWIAEALLDAARTDSASPLVIDLHPDRIDAVRACLPPSPPARLRAEPMLGPNAARLSHPSRESDLDLDGCLAALREALSALLDDSAGKVRYG
jgi:flagellar biosynthesis/type III secretory pathway protein FliH